jgi:integrase
MPKPKPKLLTDISIKNLKPQPKPYEISDGGARGLRVNVFPSGRCSFIVRYRNAAGRLRKLTLQAGVNLAQARKLAGDAMLEVAQGKDPATAKQTKRRNARSRADDSVERLVDQFIEQHVKRNTRPNSARATIGIFKNIVLPMWGRRNIHDIARRDVRDLIDGVAVDRPVQANRTRAALSTFFRWLFKREVITASPVFGVDRPHKEKSRERVLTDDEIARLWGATEALDPRARACIRLLILTGQRRSEVAGLRWHEIDGDLLMLPAERMKGGKIHIVPLSVQAAAIIAAMPRAGEFVLGAHLNNLDRVKRVLDARMGEIELWKIHDLRRTVASGMARIGVAVPVIEKVLAHVSGSFKGVAGVYQKHSFLPEMTGALQLWGDHIDRLVSGEPAKVIRLPAR